MKKVFLIAAILSAIIILAGGWYLIGKDDNGNMRVVNNVMKGASAISAHVAASKDKGAAPATGFAESGDETYLFDGVTPPDSQYVDITKTQQNAAQDAAAQAAANLNEQAAAQPQQPDNDALEMDDSQLPEELFIDGSKKPNYIEFDSNAKTAPATAQGPNAAAYNEEGLINAVSSNDIESATKILDAGISPNTADNATSTTPLFIAIANNNPEMVQLLLEHGASVTQVNDKGLMPIHEAARGAVYGSDGLFRSNEILDMLIRKGANINQKDILGETPLMLAAKAGRPDTIRFLLTRGADATAVDLDGKTAADIAVESNCTKCNDIIIAGDNRIAEVQ